MVTLVTGASGFAGSLLAPRLVRAGASVRAVARDRGRTRDALAQRAAPDVLDAIEIRPADVLSGAGLREALVDVDVAYYLIHSMERGSGGFAERELAAARNFAAAASAAGVHRIVYLGGLVPHWQEGGVAGSRHLRSREDVERVLLAAVPDSIALRASIVIGARSRSFRLMVRLVERMPVLALPAWREHRTQPLDQRDLVELLAASAEPAAPAGVHELGGPDVISYGEMLTRLAELMLVRRPALGFGVTLTGVTARVAAAIASEDPELVVPLMEGLQGDLLATDDGFAARLGVRLHSFDSAVEHALAEWERHEPLAAR